MTTTSKTTMGTVEAMNAARQIAANQRWIADAVERLYQQIQEREVENARLSDQIKRAIQHKTAGVKDVAAAIRDCGMQTDDVDSRLVDMFFDRGERIHPAAPDAIQIKYAILERR